MPKIVHVHDAVTGEVLRRNAVDARELVESDERYSHHGSAAHKARKHAPKVEADDEDEAEVKVAAAPKARKVKPRKAKAKGSPPASE